MEECYKKAISPPSVEGISGLWRSVWGKDGKNPSAFGVEIETKKSMEDAEAGKTIHFTSCPSIRPRWNLSRTSANLVLSRGGSVFLDLLMAGQELRNNKILLGGCHGHRPKRMRSQLHRRLMLGVRPWLGLSF